ncbi:DMT family transporter [Ruminococcus sp.]|uniref:DMT family transporter n=1 Tax=Ruminococcus sp. TaxID=41978 RepID=UPI0025E54254|nr:DMT family transporter [Ruminococcus sp.]
MSKKLQGSIMLLITAMIWGTAFVAQSEGMKYVRPFTYNSVRTLLGGIVLIPIIFLFRVKDKKREKSRLPETISGGICCGIILFIASSLQQYGISLTSAGKAGFITALYVIIVPLLGIFLGKKCSLKVWICAVIAVTGFYLLCIEEGLTLSKGDLYVLMCSFFYALHILTIDHFNAKNADGMMMSCIQFFTAGTLMSVCMFLFEEPHVNDIIAARYTILYTGIMSCGAAYTLQIIGQRFTPPAIATLLMSLESVFAALSGWLILSEQLSAKELTGCALVFAAVIIAQLDIKRRSA